MTEGQKAALKDAVGTMLAVNKGWKDRHQAALKIKDEVLGGECPICTTSEWDAYNVGLCEAGEGPMPCPLCEDHLYPEAWDEPPEDGSCFDEFFDLPIREEPEVSNG